MNVALALFPVVFLIFGPAVIVLSLSRVPLWPLLSSLPRPVIFVSFVVLGYVAVDFFLMFKVLPGQPEQHGAEYFFNEHGLLVPIDVHQYNQALMHAARLFTGHEIWFFGFAAVLAYQLERLRRGLVNLDVVPRDDHVAASVPDAPPLRDRGRSRPRGAPGAGCTRSSLPLRAGSAPGQSARRSTGSPS